MTLQDGQSELDTITFRFADTNVEIPGWLSYSFNQDFLKPTAEWHFLINNENGDWGDVLVGGVGVNLYLNGKIQCSGIIEKVSEVADPQNGTVLKVQGRDIMAKVVEGTVDPTLQFSTNSTLKSIVETILTPLGITKIENSDNLNLNAITGKTFLPDEDQSFSKKQLKQLKTKFGEGAFEFIDKLLKHNGFMMWAKADGSGVVVSQPNYLNTPTFNIDHVQSGGQSNNNNVLYIEKTTDITGQPALVYCKGTNPGDDDQTVTSDIMMVNELVGLDQNGKLLPAVSAAIAKYQKNGATVLPIRQPLIDIRTNPRLLFQKPIVYSPYFIKNTQPQDNEQTQNFVKRAMSHFQVKMHQLHVRVKGHTQDDIPWAVNTLVYVNSTSLGIAEPYWILEKTFSKTNADGTITDLKLIKPWTLDISTFKSSGQTQVKITQISTTQL